MTGSQSTNDGYISPTDPVVPDYTYIGKVHLKFEFPVLKKGSTKIHTQPAEAGILALQIGKCSF
jgi:hypothetical protein